MVTPIDEEIQVCAHFRGGRIFPLWFVWHGRVYKVASVTSRWRTEEGHAHRYHFAVLAPETCELYELDYHSERLSWRLARIATAE